MQRCRFAIATVRIDPHPGGLLAAVGASGSFLSANVQRLHVSGKRLKQAFGVLIVVMTTYKLFQILST